jgi:hypothetical protein
MLRCPPRESLDELILDVPNDQLSHDINDMLEPQLYTEDSCEVNPVFSVIVLDQRSGRVRTGGLRRDVF